MKKVTEETKKINSSTAKDSCSLCGQLYNNFAFKGGYVCEDCIQSIKTQLKNPPVEKK